MGEDTKLRPGSLTLDNCLLYGAGACCIVATGLAWYLSAGAMAYRASVALLEHLLEHLRRNDLLAAIIIPSILAAAVWAITSVLQFLFSRLRPRFWASVTVHSRDESFESVLSFVGQHIESSRLLATTHKSRARSRGIQDEDDNPVMERAPPRIDYKPNNQGELSVFLYHGRMVYVTREAGKVITAGEDRKPMQLESITLSTYSAAGDGTTILKQVVEEAVEADFHREEDGLAVFIRGDCWGNNWTLALRRAPRPASTVVYADGVLDRIIADASGFLAARDWYASLGIPYHRGYLLHGPPGNGKTSLCQVLATELDLDLCMLSLSDENLDDSDLAGLFRHAPPRSVIVLEDVDCMFVGRDLGGADSSSRRRGSRVTFSGLLNAIDGVATPEGNILVLTTNHKERLDPALIRPGRCDLQIEVGQADRTQARVLFERVFGKGDSSAAAEFAAQVYDGMYSMAQLQGILLENRSNGGGAAVRQIQAMTKAAASKWSIKVTPGGSALGGSTVAQFFSLIPQLAGVVPILEQQGYRWRRDLVKLTADKVVEWCKGTALLCKQADQDLLGAFLEPGDDDTSDNNPAIARVTAVDSNTIRHRMSEQYAGQKALGECVNKVVAMSSTENGTGRMSVAVLDFVLENFPDCCLKATTAFNRWLGTGENTIRLPISQLSMAALVRICGKDKDVAKALTKNGYVMALDLDDADESELEECGVDPRDAREIMAAYDRSRADLVAGMHMLTRGELISLLSKACPSIEPTRSMESVERCADDIGFTTVSAAQFNAFLDKWDEEDNVLLYFDREMTWGGDAVSEGGNLDSDDSDDGDDNDDDDDDGSKRAMEAGNEMKEWLAERKMECHADSMIEAGFTMPSDLLVGPILTDAEVKDELGISRLADRRRMIHVIREYRRAQGLSDE